MLVFDKPWLMTVTDVDDVDDQYPPLLHESQGHHLYEAAPGPTTRCHPGMMTN